MLKEQSVMKHMEHAYFCKNAKQEHWKDPDGKCTPWLLVSCGVIFLRDGFPFLRLLSIIQCGWTVKSRSLTLHGKPAELSCCPADPARTSHLHGVLGTLHFTHTSFSTSTKQTRKGCKPT